MKTVPETTFTTTDLPGTGGGGGGGAVHVTVGGPLGLVGVADAVAVDVGERVNVSVPAFVPVHEIAAVPSAPVVTAPAPGLAPAIA